MATITSSCDLGELLERLHDRYNTPAFVAGDPVSVPHRFFVPGVAVQPRRCDIEIAGFLAATIAWGNRKAIVKNAGRMIDLLGDEPYCFVMNASPQELDSVSGFVHRTFNGGDFRSFLLSLRRIYSEFGSMGGFFEGEYARTGDIRSAIARFRSEFFVPPHAARCEKHLSSIERGAACKRTNMFLRWMIRRDGRGVDFGLWQAIPASALYLPLDVHSAATARSLGLLQRRQNDWRAVEEVTARLRGFDPADPVRFDFALFGAGIAGDMKLQG
ncbi:MAG: TIGR02757 family protein [Alistipes sp.]|jgi:uncharacterized protein (TIGR02757 family)|nr:TIGR02757 family protein [Alistipes sp.]